MTDFSRVGDGPAYNTHSKCWEFKVEIPHTSRQHNGITEYEWRLECWLLTRKLSDFWRIPFMNVTMATALMDSVRDRFVTRRMQGESLVELTICVVTERHIYFDANGTQNDWSLDNDAITGRGRVKPLLLLQIRGQDEESAKAFAEHVWWEFK